MSEILDRIARFDRELDERLSTRTEACRFGTAFFHEGFPRRWDSNFVRIERSLDGIGADELSADADDVLGRAGLQHREILGVASQHGHLVSGLEALGYRTDHDVTMAHVREPDRWTDQAAEEIDLATAKRFYVSANREAEGGKHAADAEMLAGFRDVLVEHADARFFGARVDGDVVAACELYRLGDGAQVEDVFTLSAYRGRGLARAAVLAAVRAARQGGADLIFLYADDQDWPKQLYGKLGFDVVDRGFMFVKEPPRAQRA